MVCLSSSTITGKVTGTGRFSRNLGSSIDYDCAGVNFRYLQTCASFLLAAVAIGLWQEIVGEFRGGRAKWLNLSGHAVVALSRSSKPSSPVVALPAAAAVLFVYVRSTGAVLSPAPRRAVIRRPPHKPPPPPPPHSSSLFRADRAGRYADSGRRWWQFGRPVSASGRLIAFWVSTFSALGHRTRKPLCRPNVRPHFASFIGFATVRTEDLRDHIANFTTHWDPPFSSSPRRLLLRHIKLTDVNLEWK